MAKAKYSDYATLIIALLAFILTVATAIPALFESAPTHIPVSLKGIGTHGAIEDNDDIVAQIKLLQQRNTYLANQLKAQQKSVFSKDIQAIDSIAKTSKNKESEYFARKIKVLQQQINALQNHRRIDSIDSRLKSLELALGENPSKSLALPLIKRDIDGLKESEVRDIDGVKSQIASIYDLNKWFLALMLTLALSMISLVVTTILPKIEFFKKNKSTEDISQN